MHNELAITMSHHKELILFINTFLAYIMRANLKTLLNNVINVIPNSLSTFSFFIHEFGFGCDLGRKNSVELLLGRP